MSPYSVMLYLRGMDTNTTATATTHPADVFPHLRNDFAISVNVNDWRFECRACHVSFSGSTAPARAGAHHCLEMVHAEAAEVAWSYVSSYSTHEVAMRKLREVARTARATGDQRGAAVYREAANIIRRMP